MTELKGQLGRRLGGDTVGGYMPDLDPTPLRCTGGTRPSPAYLSRCDYVYQDVHQLGLVNLGMHVFVQSQHMLTVQKGKLP